jgi:hypothetical protein
MLLKLYNTSHYAQQGETYMKVEEEERKVDYMGE